VSNLRHRTFPDGAGAGSWKSGSMGSAWVRQTVPVGTGRRELRKGSPSLFEYDSTRRSRDWLEMDRAHGIPPESAPLSPRALSASDAR